MFRNRALEALCRWKHDDASGPVRSQGPVILLVLVTGVGLFLGVHAGCYGPVRASGEPSAPRSEIGVPSGWTVAETFDEDYSLVFRDGYDLMVLDGGEQNPRYVPTTPDSAFFSTPSWSADGACMFDCETQVISIATDTGEARYLTSYPVHQDGWPEEPISMPVERFVHHPAENRLFYATLPEVVSLDLSDLSQTTVLRADTLGSEFLFYTWALRLADQRFYARSNDRIVSCTLEGTQIAEFTTAPLTAFEVSLVLDGKTLLAERYEIHGEHDYEWGLGCWLLDAETLEVKGELEEGHSFRWSSQGDRIAFLVNSEELWIYDVGEDFLTQLAYVTPGENAPEWSRFRYFAYPAWSHDDRMIACGLATWSSGYHNYHYYTVIFDLEGQQYVDIPEHWRYLSWSPGPRPFLGSENP